MAILRIGSRQPTFTQDDSGFSFFGPSPIMLSDPQSVETVHDWDGVEQMQMPERYSPPSIRGEVQPNNVIPNSIVPNANMSGEVPPMRMPQRDLQMQNPPVQIPAVNVPPIVPGSSGGCFAGFECYGSSRRRVGSLAQESQNQTADSPGERRISGVY
jgi:hypothetical protein